MHNSPIDIYTSEENEEGLHYVIHAIYTSPFYFGPQGEGVCRT